ncbi:MAG: hypothetical protein COU32_02030 [Candidatus Magasanikbacteria bacterium CG10_big_fil_rev_8_21_14_0_10_42_10]|uniref:SHSP domain-containing protein n=2 Tax=Candidatus Magasanikiibacteriota TaxID=1752731 RepID=A0A2H0TWD0_9BACT|nr:MAG: hypothetical protein COU32_02030 [Candidatus Magasanikbacteria bacterium CG10_big_fil_rev_8_21_14_0_10_42_10]PIZ93329.1 MAG: hypothetical protein COX82_02805 [Candidatus Magasanikbacteria bacterium CG_4_10_14_0_2_um_filter_41_10]
MSTRDDDMFALILASQQAERNAPISVISKKQGDFPSDWAPTNEGRLAIDVYDMNDHIIILAPMAGVDPTRVDIYIHDDMLSIRGKRIKPKLTEEASGQYHAECYWGAFSRSIVLPVDVVSGAAVAEYTHGLLTIRIPKVASSDKGRSIPIEIVEE